MDWPDLKPHKLVVYSTVWCGDCRRLKGVFEENGVDFEERDIDADPEAATALKTRTGRGAIPYVEINGQAFVRGWHDEDPMRWNEMTFLSEIDEALTGN